MLTTFINMYSALINLLSTIYKNIVAVTKRNTFVIRTKQLCSFECLLTGYFNQPLYNSLSLHMNVHGHLKS